MQRIRLTCKGVRVHSEDQTTDRHARKPGLIHRERQLTNIQKESVQYGVRQLTDIQESQCSVRCQAAD